MEIFICITIILCILIIYGGFALIVFYCQEIYSRDIEDDIFSNNLIREYPSIKYRDFLQYYFLNKESWILREIYVIKVDKDKFIKLKFNLIDWYKYKIFLTKIKKSNRNKSLKKILKHLQEKQNNNER